MTGGAAYVQDMRLPGMLHGRVVRPPRYGSTLESVDEAAVKAMPGVIAVVRDGSFLGVVAEREEQAIKARDALRQEREMDARARSCPIRHASSSASSRCRARTTTIGVKQARVPANATHFEAVYTKPYMAHASIGPSCALAEFKDGSMTVWTHSQGVFPLRGELVKALKMPASRGALHACRRLGLLRPQRRRRRRGRCGAARARGAGPPGARAMDARRRVRLGALRARHGDARQGRARRDGKIADWDYELWSNSHSTRPASTTGTNVLAAWYLAEPQKMGPPTSPPQPAGGGDRNAIPLYDFPSQRVVHHFVQDMPIRVSALRTLGAYANVFASNRSWTSWRRRPAPIRWLSGSRT